jgi:hypothetical protein
MRKRIQVARAFMLLAASGVAIMGILTGPQAGAATGQQIVNVGSGQCLAVLSTISSEAVQEPCSSKNLSEFWEFVPVCTQLGCTNQYEIRNSATSLCLTRASLSAPVIVEQSGCSASLNDVWKRQPNSSSQFEVTSDLDGASMHPNSNSNNSGAVIYVNFAGANAHYLWKLGLSII